MRGKSISSPAMKNRNASPNWPRNSISVVWCVRPRTCGPTMIPSRISTTTTGTRTCSGRSTTNGAAAATTATISSDPVSTDSMGAASYPAGRAPRREEGRRRRAGRAARASRASWRGPRLLSDPERAPHERVDPAEVRVGAGREVARRRPRVGARRGGCEAGAEAERGRVEVDGPVGERVGDAGAAVAGRRARGDRVLDALGRLASSLTNVRLWPCWISGQLRLRLFRSPAE